MSRMKSFLSIALLAAAPLAQAQPADTPPAIRDTPPRVEVKGAEPLTEPDAAELLPPKHEVHGETRIEQRRIGTRVREIVVTPAGRSYSYTIENREAGGRCRRKISRAGCRPRAS